MLALLSDFSSGLLSALGSGLLSVLTSGLASSLASGLSSGLAAGLASDLISGLASALLSSGFFGSSAFAFSGRGTGTAEICFAGNEFLFSAGLFCSFSGAVAGAALIA